MLASSPGGGRFSGRRGTEGGQGDSPTDPHTLKQITDMDLSFHEEILSLVLRACGIPSNRFIMVRLLGMNITQAGEVVLLRVLHRRLRHPRYW